MAHRERTILDDWKDRDRKAEEGENKALGRPIQKPPRKKKKKKKELEDFAKELREGGRKQLEDFSKGLPELPQRPRKKKDDMRWKYDPHHSPPYASKTVDLKKGGKVRGAGLARRRRS